MIFIYSSMSELPEAVSITHLSIGDLSVACGISPHTLRVWERRYGKPVAVRLPSGHRRYAASDVGWLRLVHELLAYGHRPSKVLALDPTTLEQEVVRERSTRMDDQRVQTWLDTFHAAGIDELRRRVHDLLEQTGPLQTVQTVIAGFVEQVGREWAEGRLTIAQEHAITEVLEDLLRTERLRLEQADPPCPLAPRMLLATVSGERHGLGLQMAALVLTQSGCAPVLLGVDLPPEEIVSATKSTRVDAIGISVSLASGGPDATHQLQALRAAVPERVEVLVGGLGARSACRGLRGVQVLGEMRELEQWARARVLERGA